MTTLLTPPADPGARKGRHPAVRDLANPRGVGGGCAADVGHWAGSSPLPSRTASPAREACRS